jgi:hypothetical protein
MWKMIQASGTIQKPSNDNIIQNSDLSILDHFRPFHFRNSLVFGCSLFFHSQFFQYFKEKIVLNLFFVSTNFYYFKYNLDSLFMIKKIGNIEIFFRLLDIHFNEMGGYFVPDQLCGLEHIDLWHFVYNFG